MAYLTIARISGDPDRLLDGYRGTSPLDGRRRPRPRTDPARRRATGRRAS